MRLQCVFSSDIDKTYDIAIGSTITDCFNEELDSAKIIITHIPKANRLTNLKCYEYVYIYDLDSGFNRYFLVDNYVENIQNVYELYYEYTISLMSETKMLEKIQLPNRVITHSLVSGQKTVREILYEFCSLYIPKIKFTDDKETWQYKYIFDFSALIDATSDIYSKFDILCPDMSFSQPTLKKAITQLMEVVGCIPIITNRKLSYLDLRATPTTFNTANTNYIARSLSSDSVVNTLTNMGDNILDNKNEIISEVLGFRDKNNVYLKQEENLNLETSKPIYEVYDFVVCGYIKRLINLKNDDNHTVNIGIVIGDPDASFTLRYVDSVSTKLYNTQIVFAKINNYTSKLEEVSRLNVGTLSTETKTYSYTIPSGATIAIIYGYTSSTSTDYQYLCYCNSYISDTNNNADLAGTEVWQYAYYEKDITPLIVEQSKRNALETDFTKMPSATSIDDLAKYYYATVGYSIGTKKISGFSSTYTQSYGFWNETYTYIENIWNAILKIDKLGDKTTLQDISDAYLLADVGLIVKITTPTIYSPLGSNSLFTSLFFNIKYRPLNSLNIKYFKEDIDINTPIEQLDTQETSIPSFDDMANREIDKANRLGNDTYQISQRLSNISELNPLNSLYDTDKIVYKREIAIYNDFIQVSYTASKDYVLKNYFTSIQTKYRAYEYVDYNKSTIRKENKVIFVSIDDYYFNGDDNIWVGSQYYYNDHNELSMFLSGALKKSDTQNNLIYFMFSQDTLGQIPFKNELSSIVAKNILAFNYQDIDNASAGTYIKVLTAQNGGLPQSWLMFPMSYYTTKQIGLIGQVDFVSTKPYFVDASTVDNELEKVYHEPRVPLSVFNPPRNETPNIWLVDKNTGSFGYTDYKDYGEIMNRTLEFVFYTTSPDIEWRQKFIELCEFYDYETLNTNNRMILSATDIEMSDNAKLTTSVNVLAYNENYISLDTSNTKAPCIRVHWGAIDAQYNYIEVINISESNYYDVIKFHRPKTTTISDTKYYVSLNDNKTNKIYLEDDNTGLWFGDYAITKNSSTRIVGTDSKEFRVSLVYFSESSEYLSDFEVSKVYFSEEVETV